MPKSKQAVRDKYYTLAKEQGYRARSSFKLLELNRKYKLLDKATKVIDLCAAPGGWLQVCAKAMPPVPERQIIGVDLLPIKPLKGCVTFQADITTAHCRQLVRHELKDGGADVVLCDGAPNVGSDYSKDAFVQAELALCALKVATEHLREGGAFVTKVFRSADYNALMWVFQQLFRKVEATKPASSRNVSAEIFVVCREYIAPDKIDPRLLDAKSVFEQIESGGASGPMSLGRVFDDKNPQRRFRAGYDESKGQVLFTATPASSFVESSDPVRVLTESNALTFDDDASVALLGAPATSAEVRALCKDLKVIGKSDFRTLLRWRLQVRPKPTPLVAAGDAAAAAEDDEDELTAKALASDAARRKREDKKTRRERAKLQQKKDMGIVHPFALDVSEREGPFSLAAVGARGVDDARLDGVREGAGEAPTEESTAAGKPALTAFIADSDAYLEAVEESMDAEYERFARGRALREPLSIAERRRQQTADKTAKRKKSALEQMTEADFQRAVAEAQREAYDKGVYHKMLKQGGSGSEDDDDDGGGGGNDGADRPTARVVEGASAAAWFAKEEFKDLSSSSSSSSGDDDDDAVVADIGLPSEGTDKAKRALKRRKVEERRQRREAKKQRLALAAAKLFDPSATAPGFKVVARDDDDDGGGRDGAAPPVDAATQELIRKGMGRALHGDEPAGIQVVAREAAQPAASEAYDSDEYDSDERATHLALGSLLARKSTRGAVLDAAYNRYAWNDGPLPAWFAEDESKHNRPVLPVTQEMIQSVKARFADTAADAPIKKVAEARMRKRKRAALKLEAAKKKAAAVVDEPDMSARSKMRQIEKLYRSATVKRPGAVYVVAGKTGSKTAVGKTKGKRVKIVDRREKKDKRGIKRAVSKLKGSAKKQLLKRRHAR